MGDQGLEYLLIVLSKDFIMRFKNLFATALILITGASFANAVTPLNTMTRNTACGNPAPQPHDPKWCSCFHNYLCKTICKTRECSDSKLSKKINAYGGIIAFCSNYPMPDLDARACEDQLIGYFEQCPNNN